MNLPLAFRRGKRRAPLCNGVRGGRGELGQPAVSPRYGPDLALVLDRSAKTAFAITQMQGALVLIGDKDCMPKERPGRTDGQR